MSNKKWEPADYFVVALFVLVILGFIAMIAYPLLAFTASYNSL